MAFAQRGREQKRRRPNCLTGLICVVLSVSVYHIRRLPFTLPLILTFCASRCRRDCVRALVGLRSKYITRTYDYITIAEYLPFINMSLSHTLKRFSFRQFRAFSFHLIPKRSRIYVIIITLSRIHTKIASHFTYTMEYLKCSGEILVGAVVFFFAQSLRSVYLHLFLLQFSVNRLYWCTRTFYALSIKHKMCEQYCLYKRMNTHLDLARRRAKEKKQQKLFCPEEGDFDPACVCVCVFTFRSFSVTFPVSFSPHSLACWSIQTRFLPPYRPNVHTR